jgi:dATP pyrophosphohydrolase
MARAPIQIIVILYRLAEPSTWEFAVFQRADGEMWQFVSGGAEDNETPIEAARREAQEEGGVPANLTLQQLDSVASVPRSSFPTAQHWHSSIHVVPEYSFAVNVGNMKVVLSHEHRKVLWCTYERARDLLTWDSNRTALWELKERLKNGGEVAA